VLKLLREPTEAALNSFLRAYDVRFGMKKTKTQKKKKKKKKKMTTTMAQESKETRKKQ